MLCCVIGGSGTVEMDGSVLHMKPGELLYAEPGTCIGGLSRGEPFAFVALFFRALQFVPLEDGTMSVSAASMHHPLFAKGHLPVQASPDIGQMFEEIYRNSLKDDPFSLRLQLERLLHGLMQALTSPPAREEDGIERSIRFMKEKLAEKLDLMALAEAAGLKPDTYSRLFKKRTSDSPVEYLNRMRLDKAKELLEQEVCRVKEVSAAVGFSSEFYFSRMFNRTVGISPSLYRRRGQLKVAFASTMGFQDIMAGLDAEVAAVVDLYKYPWMTEREHAFLLRNELERLKASVPGLIIADHYYYEFYDELKQIAPTVILDAPDWDWRANCFQIAELTRKEKQIRAALDELDLHTYKVSRTLEKQIGVESVTVLQVNHKTIGIQGTNSHPLNTLLYHELGLKACAAVSTAVWRQEVMPELLPRLETGHLFIQMHHVRAGSKHIFRRMTETSSWQSMDAVRQNRPYQIPNWFTMSWTPVGRHHILNELLKYAGTVMNPVIQRGTIPD